MEYEFQDIHLLLKMMLINVKDLHRTMTKVDKILYGQKLREYILNKIINKLLTYKSKDGKI